MDLKDLSELRDAESRDTYLSLYRDLSDATAERALDGRAGEIRAALPDDAARKAFDAAYEQAARAAGKLRGGGGARGAAVFAALGRGVLHAQPLQEPVRTALVLDSGPYIRPLARYLDEHEAFVLVLLDGSRAAVYVVAAGKAELAGSARSRLMGRHTKGGWSQMRYQRHRQGAMDRFLAEVAGKAQEAMAEAGATRVVVAGPGQAKRQMLSLAPKALQDAVIATEDVDFADSDDAMVRRFAALARAEEAEASEEALGAFRGELRRGELALAGAFPVVRAAREGRVEMLLVRKDHGAGGRKCEAHQSYFERDGACHCGSKGTEVDLMNEAVEDTIRHHGRVEFVADGDGFLRGLGGVGALLRW